MHLAGHTAKIHATSRLQNHLSKHMRVRKMLLQQGALSGGRGRNCGQPQMNKNTAGFVLSHLQTLPRFELAKQMTSRNLL